jgi:ABC-2 type transport system permease protein
MVHLRSILAIVRKDALDVWLDKAKLAALLAPLALALIWLVLSRLLTPQPAQPTQLLVYNPGQSPLQQVISGIFPSTEITQASSPQQVAAAFAVNGTSTSAGYDVGLVIPAGFEDSLKAGNRPQVNLYLNSTVSSQEALLQAAVSYYARTVVSPTSPVSLVTESLKPAPTSTTPQITLGGVYTNLVVPISFGASIAILPGLLIEEKEKKTLRMLMVSPASFADVLIGKVIVVFVYQMALTMTVLALFGAFTGNVPLLLLYSVCGALLALSVGFLIGTMLETAGAAGSLEAVASFAFIIPSIFVPLATYISGSAVSQIIKMLPTYYLAEGIYNALNNLGTPSSNVIDISVTLGSAAVILVGTLWLLRRQAQVAAVI